MFLRSNACMTLGDLGFMTNIAWCLSGRFGSLTALLWAVSAYGTPRPHVQALRGEIFMGYNKQG